MPDTKIVRRIWKRALGPLMTTYGAHMHRLR